MFRFFLRALFVFVVNTKIWAFNSGYVLGVINKVDRLIERDPSLSIEVGFLEVLLSDVAKYDFKDNQELKAEVFAKVEKLFDRRKEFRSFKILKSLYLMGYSHSQLLIKIVPGAENPTDLLSLAEARQLKVCVDAIAFWDNELEKKVYETFEMHKGFPAHQIEILNAWVNYNFKFSQPLAAGGLMNTFMSLERELLKRLQEGSNSTQLTVTKDAILQIVELRKSLRQKGVPIGQSIQLFPTLKNWVLTFEEDFRIAVALELLSKTDFDLEFYAEVQERFAKRPELFLVSAPVLKQILEGMVPQQLRSQNRRRQPDFRARHQLLALKEMITKLSFFCAR